MQVVTDAAKTAFDTSPVKRKYKVWVDWITKGDTPGTITADEWDSTYFSKGNINNNTFYIRFKPLILSDSMRLGDNVRIISDKYENSWLGDTRSDSAGEFSPAEVISIIYDDVILATHLTISGSQYNYPVDMDLYYRDDTDTSWVLCESYTGLTNYITVYEFASLTNIKGWKLEITKISLSDMLAEIAEVSAGFREDVLADLVKEPMEVHKELEYSGASISIGNISANTLRLYLENTDRKYNPDNEDSYLYPYLKYNKVIQPFIGVDLGDSIEWFAQGKYYIKEINPQPDMTVEIYAVDRMILMNEEDFESSLVYEGYTKSELVQLLAEAFGLGATEYDIEVTTAEIPYAYFTPRKYAEDIKRLEIADGGVAFFDELGIFKSKTRGWSEAIISAYYDDSKIKKNSASSPVKASSMKNYIRIKSNPLYLLAQQEVYKVTQNITIPAGGSREVACYFNKKPCLNVVDADFTQSSTHITITSELKYSFVTFLTFTNSGGADEDVLTITIDAEPLEATGANEVISQDAESILRYGLSPYEIDSEFIQDMDSAQELGDDLLADYKDPEALELEIEAPSRPYLQLGDTVAVRCTKLNIGGAI